MSQQMQGRPPLEEFDRVLHGIDSLALALQDKIESERTVEFMSATLPFHEAGALW